MRGLYHILFTALMLLPGIFIQSTRAQQYAIDSLKQKLAACNTDTMKVKTMVEISFYQTQPEEGIRWANEALQLASHIGYRKGEASALVQLSAHHCNSNDFIMALHYASRSIRIREEIHDETGLSSSYNMIALVYRELGDGKNAITYLQKTLQLLPANDNKKTIYKKAVVNGSMGRAWMSLQNTDSASLYYQRSYELFNLSGNKYQMSLATSGLGDVEMKRGNFDIAMGFYKDAIKNCETFNDSIGYAETCYKLAVFFQKIQQNDSARHYCMIAFNYADVLNEYKTKRDAALLLYEVSQNDSKDSKLKWLETAWNTTKMMNEKDRTGQIKTLLMEEELHRKEKEEIEKQSGLQRKKMIEYSLLAIGIFSFLIIIQLLSRSIIINEKWVGFLGILSLLLIFEFVNLILHPFLENITHHSPALILLCMVLIAAMLIPLHHKIEHWLITLLKERNRKYRLSSAKKIISTIEKTENQDNEDNIKI